MKSTGLFIISKLLFNLDHVMPFKFQISRAVHSLHTASLGYWTQHGCYSGTAVCCLKCSSLFTVSKTGKKTTLNTATMVPKHLEFNNQLPSEMMDQSWRQKPNNSAACFRIGNCELKTYTFKARRGRSMQKCKMIHLYFKPNFLTFLLIMG